MPDNLLSVEVLTGLSVNETPPKTLMKNSRRR